MLWVLLSGYKNHVQPSQKHHVPGSVIMSATSKTGINEIAEKLGMSVSTVSIVLNGRGDDLRISKTTQKRILDYCKELNYQPNIYARRLRASGREETPPVIALFIPMQTNGIMIGRFLNGMQSIPEISTHKIEIILQPFNNNQLSTCAAMITRNHYSGAIIVGMSTKDEKFIYNTDFNIPIVLLNRSCRRHSVVCVDNDYIGRIAAELFQRTGHNRVAMVLPEEQTGPLNQRSTSFQKKCRELKLYLPEQNIIRDDMTYSGGKRAIERLLAGRKEDFPTAIFFLESSMAIGSLPVFHEAGIQIPRDVQLLSYGDNGQEQVTIPSLSSIRMPTEDMSSSCIRILLKFLSTNQWDHTIIKHESPIVLRESFVCPKEALADL
jgi:DNA-binding LacI/PurR family transcriptional regulator